MREIKSKRGFSTAEMLLATLILSLSMMLLSNGAAVIQRIYRRTLAATDAQMILSQTETRLRNDLSMATKCDFDADGKTVTRYYISSVGYELTVSNGVLYRKDGEGNLDQLSLKNVRRLEDLKIPNAPTIQYADGCFTVSDLQAEYSDNRGAKIPFKYPDIVIRALQSVTS